MLDSATSSPTATDFLGMNKTLDFFFDLIFAMLAAKEGGASKNLQIYMKCLFSNQFCCVSLVSSNSIPLSTRVSSARLSLYMIGIEVTSTLAILNGPRLVPPGTET